MISITSNKVGTKYTAKIKMNFNKEVTFEVYALFKCMLVHHPESFHAVLDKLMTEIAESTYNIDPEKFAEYRLLLEDYE